MTEVRSWRIEKNKQPLASGEWQLLAGILPAWSAARGRLEVAITDDIAWSDVIGVT